MQLYRRLWINSKRDLFLFIILQQHAEDSCAKALDVYIYQKEGKGTLNIKNFL